MTDSNHFIIMVYNISNITLILLCMIYMENSSGRDWPRRRGQNWSPGFIGRQSSRSSTSTIPSTSPSSSSSSQEFSTTPEPARATSLPSTYASDTEEYPVALPMILLVVCVIGTLACGIALCAHNMWKAKTKQKQRRNDQQKENHHSSVQDVVDWNL